LSDLFTVSADVMNSRTKNYALVPSPPKSKMYTVVQKCHCIDSYSRNNRVAFLDHRVKVEMFEAMCTRTFLPLKTYPILHWIYADSGFWNRGNYKV